MRTLNPTYFDDVSDYLTANGYSRAKSTSGVGFYFKKDTISVMLLKDRLEVITLENGEGQYQSFTGASFLTVFNLMLLFHLTGVVHLRAMAKAGIKALAFSPLEPFIDNETKY